jgi:7-keto-8-aminopelargonate synthetase-like enzyme
MAGASYGRSQVKVVAGGNEELVAWVEESTRDLVATTLEAHSAAVADSLSYEKADSGRARQKRYLEQIAALRSQLEDTSGPVVLSGSASLVVEVIRDTATQATHDLDGLVENISATPSRLSDDTIAELRTRTQVTNACVEALIACEDSRGRV